MRLTHPHRVGLLLGLSLLGCDPAQRDTTEAHAALVKAVYNLRSSTDADLALAAESGSG
ncbi:MAG: hypothetical protein ACI8RZ_002115 [Myxococcota bacterium]|jgi:hypothetical protein